MTQPKSLTLKNVARMRNATLLLALTGWMDGGLASTGTVRQLMEERELVDVGRIEPGGFYIDNFPGSMEVTALFRPRVKYTGGLVTEFEMEENAFHADVERDLAFFVGAEPNIDWPGFAECIYHVAAQLGVRRIIFMGSFGGSVPHTREPRLYGSVSESRLLPLLKDHGLQPSDYEGPGSFATYLLNTAKSRGIEMLSISAEIPGYLQGINPLSIGAITRRLARILNVPVDLGKLRDASTAWELKVTEAIEKDEDLAKTVRKLEDQYDSDLIRATEGEQ